MPAGARVTQGTRIRDHPSQNASPIFLGLCSRFSLPGATQSAVGLWTRSTPGGQSLQARAARRGGGTLRGRLGVGWRTPGPAPRALAAGWPGSPASRTYMWSQPLPPSGKQPVPSVDGREVGVTPLASSALPQTEDLSSLGKLPQLHVAAKEVALQSVRGLVAV